MKIAVDAMGGDDAPEVVVQGALEAASKFGIHVILVGHETVLTGLLDAHAANGHVSIHHCEDVVGMGESPLKALRKKKDSSIRVAFGLAKEGRADAVISAGNSGATLAAGVLALGRIRGVERPAIASIFPTEKGPVILIDAGANVDCRPAQLFQFGVMAHAFGCSCLEMTNPEIALLNIGEEGGKGNELVRCTYDLFKNASSSLNFVGNIEGRDLLKGDVKIVVCDGFVGNVALKLTEGDRGVHGPDDEKGTDAFVYRPNCLDFESQSIFSLCTRIELRGVRWRPPAGHQGSGNGLSWGIFPQSHSECHPYGGPVCPKPNS